MRDDNTDRARAKEKTQTVFDGSVAKVKKAPVPLVPPVERTEDGLPLKKRYKLYYMHILGPNGKTERKIVPVEVKEEEKVMSSEKSISPIIKVEEDSDHEI